MPDRSTGWNPSQLSLQRVTARRQIQEAKHAVAGASRRDCLPGFQISQRDRNAAQSESGWIAENSLRGGSLNRDLSGKTLALVQAVATAHSHASAASLRINAYR